MPTPKQIKAAKKISENLASSKPKSTGEVLREAGYSQSVSETPSLVTETKGFQELLEEYMPDEMLMEVHQGLLKTTKIEHMVFPTGYKLTADKPEGDEGKTLSDEEIIDMLADIGCECRKIVHGETARHVYYWSPDANARKSAVELAYKIKGRITNTVKHEGEIRTNPFGALSTEELRKLTEGKDGNV